MSMHVLVVGGGLGGLCLAQGLQKSGFQVSVFERDRHPTDCLQGYRVHINPRGSRALCECLPPELFERFASSCGRSSERFSFYTETLQELLRLQVANGEDPVDRHWSASRISLRQVLLCGLSQVHFDRCFEHYQVRRDGQVVAHFQDGSQAVGDLLVGADGGNSRVRQQLLPHARRVDTGVRGIAAKIPLTAANRYQLHPTFLEGPALVSAGRGAGMFLAPQELGAGAFNDEDLLEQGGSHFENTQSYLMWALGSRLTGLPSSRELEKLSGPELIEVALGRMQGWHPAFHQLAALSDPETVSLLTIRTSLPVPAWEPSSVTLLGDAIHSMTPYRGIGANVALRDASVLRRALVGQGSLLEAVKQYETRMRSYAYPAVRGSLKAMDQALCESRLRLNLGRALMRLLNALPTLVKTWIFRNLGRD